MRKLMHSLAVFLMTGLVSTADAAWTYTETETVANGVSHGILTDGVWTIPADRAKNSTNLTANANNGSTVATDPSPIDFTTVADESGTAYAVVKFCQFSGRTATKSTLYASRHLLSEFIAPDCETVAGEACFYDCTNLRKVVLKDNATIAFNYIFQGCTSLVDFFPRTLTGSKFYSCAFQDCSSLSGRIEFSNATTLTGSMFQGCSSLEEVIAPKATVVEGKAFQDCTSLTNVVLSSAVEKIHQAVFSGCTKLEDACVQAILSSHLVQLGHSTTVEGSAFKGCGAIAGPLVWDQPSLTKKAVMTYTFENCTNLAEFVFKTPVDLIDTSAFHNLKGGAEIYMPADPPTTFGTGAVVNDTAPYSRIYLKDNFAAWIDTIYANTKHHVILKSEFNDSTWKSKNRADITWDRIVKPTLANDATMCYTDADGKIRLLNKTVLGFLLYDNWGKGGAWILRTPKVGMSVLVK